MTCSTPPSEPPPPAEAEARAAVTTIHDRAAQVRAEAEKHRLRTLAEAEAEARQVVKEAEARAQEVRASSRTEAQEVLNDAHYAAREVVRDGEELTGNLRDLAQSLVRNADRLMRDVHGVHHQLTSRLDEADPGEPAEAPMRDAAPAGPPARRARPSPRARPPPAPSRELPSRRRRNRALLRPVQATRRPTPARRSGAGAAAGAAPPRRCRWRSPGCSSPRTRRSTSRSSCGRRGGAADPPDPSAMRTSVRMDGAHLGPEGRDRGARHRLEGRAARHRRLEADGRGRALRPASSTGTSGCSGSSASGRRGWATSSSSGPSRAVASAGGQLKRTYSPDGGRCDRRVLHGRSTPSGSSRSRDVTQTSEHVVCASHPQRTTSAPALQWRSSTELGAIAQLGERLAGSQEVGGSSPPGSIETT